MGVHELWSIIEPVRESVPLYSLSGKTLAVDLSLWVCEAQHVQAMMGRVNKPHLRNLFFRVSSLTLMGIKLVFVMEGEAPKIKAETMSKRTLARYGGFKKTSSTTSTGRGRFKAVLKECADMLDILGVPWVTAAGEAEAMCAFLDSQGLVDGCITNDGDAFLYGAQIVYRNFHINSKDPLVDCYKTSRVQTELHLSRENLVGLAVLLGCDYIPKGIPGVGKEQALKLLRMLKEQTLLQWFTQWEEQNAGTPEVVLKKVAHCPVCHHPGSAKAHERGGCVLCKSNRFCHPQDFDYECPCDWHRYERTRQVSSFETNIRKKTMASPHFPFTKIISEFLISKDKPVSHFKRRQPNMLLMQKFAHEKMEWPKHYTSEKVLVLLTYAELMNKKYGRDVSTQIKPLRILKSRVRNGVPCFEIVWRTPEHYSFPDQQPAEDHHEVRTIEEATLFRVAFPEVVEKYLKDKSMAEGKKTRSKKSKWRKEAPSDQISDDISECLAKLSLQNSAAPPQTPHPVISTDEPVFVDNPLDHDWNLNEGQSGIDQHPITSVASPSDSAVIDALHLSNIDWDALSFTSSPPAPSAAQAKPSTERQKTSRGVEEADSSCAAQLCYTERSLRERLLLKNMAIAADQEEACEDSKQLKNNNPSSSPNVDGHEEVPTNHGRINPLSDNINCASSSQLSDAPRVKHREAPVARPSRKTKNLHNGRQKPPQKDKFVTKSASSSGAQHCPDPSQSWKNLPRIKSSVCVSVDSSSEDSDTENRQIRPQGKARIKPVDKIKANLCSGVALKAISGPTPSKAASPVQLPRVEHGCSLEIRTNIMPVWDQDNSPAKVNSDAFLQDPASPVVVTDSDDSVVCSESPLPLAERLRLKFLK
ncbi:flap endonuclease GEN homolog 1 [Takifugu flavidus]|uniref:Flap endonuclease GEN homolog 1 n=1 Tax=Takifugu flavidus TaxID=433684 RepID=A0A5C6NPP0_9TELE|nr:flap endonuclease GEN homolog 1 [Takifugu flavidus]TWW68638.1 Flap endonuclease GEN -like protein 1 [Takifugu flavidus]